MNNIKDRAVLVKFMDKVWMGGAIDSEVSERVNKDAGAKVDTGHYWKRLVPKAAIRPRANAGNACRRFHFDNTLPWMEGGVRILPVANFKEYMTGMRKLMDAARVEEKTFVKEYPNWIKEARKSHGKMFNEDDFPDPRDISAKFDIDVAVFPMPNIADWRVELDAEQVTALRKEAEQRITAIQSEGIRDMYSRLQELLSHLAAKLDDDSAIFRDSAVENIKQLVSLMSRLNVTGDKNLEAVRKDTEKAIAKISASDLRDDPVKRSRTAKDARAIMKKMSGYMKGVK